MWLIASIPFWALGALFTFGAIAAGPGRKPQETTKDIIKQIVSCLLIAGVFFIIAAKIAS